MIRNLKILVAAAMALAAFGAISTSGTQAAEFHCSVEPCTITLKPDGMSGPLGKTAHFVLVVKQGAASVATTCQQVTGDATVATKTFKTITLGQLVFHACNGPTGAPAVIRANGCEFHFVSPGIAPHDATMQVKCPGEKSIEIEDPASGCLKTIGTTGVLGGGLKFHDAETGGIPKTEITVETTVNNIPMTIHKLCGPLAPGAAVGEITTWSYELTGETPPGVHQSLWWQ
jgi:hypothetical protein